MIDGVVKVNVDYENRWNEDEALEKWAMYNCDGFLGTYSNWEKLRPVRSEQVAIKTFYFDNEKSAMLFSLRWL
jgi:hypothetical protein